ncbi:sialidase family protein [Amycolatopsis endophytica]|uniref:Exo-alpha-sialidase n=1 Tax=Amycolatopsis endophytica TaxID=860233 RepID=A0A853AZ48_9PSEU|nr:sialidase family protein [Amycolatopsis endophytica]NYI87897.1 hypothetical protein [Amycolatopsis endophytica]
MRRMIALVLTLLVAVTTTIVPAEAARRGDLGVGAYPRAIRLEHTPFLRGRIIASVNSWDSGGAFARIFESADEGASFHQVGEVRDPEGAQGECCGSIYELPQRVGRLRAGTLLWAASYGQNGGAGRRMSIRVWSSSDGGRNWTFRSEAARSHNHDGVFEPEFTVDSGGTLWIHYADETEAPRYSQVLNRVGSTDGVTWGTKQTTLAIPPDRVRPGMPVVRELPDGRYYFSYEICNYGKRYCDPYFKISADGANYGDPADPGTRVATANGSYFQHAHTVTTFPGGPNGVRLLMVGQIYTDSSGRPLPSNGQVLLANDHLGSGDWYEIPAPAPVPNAHNDFCPNYSSSLLPVDSGRNVLELAADYDGGVCKVYFGTGPAS